MDTVIRDSIETNYIFNRIIAPKKAYRQGNEKHFFYNTTNEKLFKNYTLLQSVLPIRKDKFNKNELPSAYKHSAESLVNLACFVLDRMKLPVAFEWSNADVCKWIREYGYPQYQNTFRVNNVTGQKLLLIGAQHLCEMNIKNFDDIKRIAHGIRLLYGYQLVHFGRNKSLPPHNFYDHYVLYQTQTGTRYKHIRPSDLWRKLQMIRPASKYLQHWQLLDNRMNPKGPPEIIANAKRENLYSSKRVSFDLKTKENVRQTDAFVAKGYKSSLVEGFTILRDRKCKSKKESFKYDGGGKVLTCLKDTFPYKYVAMENAGKEFYRTQILLSKSVTMEGY